MRAALFERHGGPEVLRLAEVPEAALGPLQVRVRVRAVALNHIDVWLRRGLPKLKIALPHVGGADICGELSELGEGVRGLSIGQRVLVNPVLSCGRCEHCQGGADNLCADYGLIGESRWGGTAESVVVSAASVLPLPEGLSDVVWAAVPVAYMTAWHMLVDRACLRPGESVLVWAGGSGVGLAAIQIARLFGAQVLVTASTEEKRVKLLELGADVALDPADPELVRIVRDHTGGRGVNVVFEHTGAETFAHSVRAAARGGRIVTCGATTGPVAALDLRHVFWRQLSILGATLAPRARLFRIVEHVAAGRLCPVIDRTLPLAQIADGHRAIEARAVLGKIVLVV